MTQLQINKSECFFKFIIAIYCVTLVSSFISSVILACKLVFYYKEKFHGVHETNFTFTGDYIISTNIDDDDNHVYYTSKCQSVTQFGDCYYDCYKCDLYEDAANYATNYCISGTTLVGYISSDEQCWTSNPNNKVYKLLLIFRIILSYFVINIIIWIFIHCKYIKWNKNKTTTTNYLHKSEFREVLTLTNNNL